MNRKRTIAGLALFALLGSWAAAAGLPQAEPQTRMSLRENISTLYLLRLTRALELNEEQTARIFPLLTRIERDKAERQRRLNAALAELRSALANPKGAGEARILELVGRVRDDREAIRRMDEEAEAAFDEVLTAVQKGRYLLFTVDFYRTLGRHLEKARQMRPGPKRRP